MINIYFKFFNYRDFILKWSPIKTTTISDVQIVYNILKNKNKNSQFPPINR